MKTVALRASRTADYLLARNPNGASRKTMKVMANFVIDNAGLEYHGRDLHHRPYLVLMGKVDSLVGDFGGGVTEVSMAKDSEYMTCHYDFNEVQLERLVAMGLFTKEFRDPVRLQDSMLEVETVADVIFIEADKENESPIIFVDILKSYVDIDEQNSGYDLVDEFDTVLRDKPLTKVAAKLPSLSPELQAISDDLFPPKDMEEEVWEEVVLTDAPEVVEDKESVEDKIQSEMNAVTTDSQDVPGLVITEEDYSTDTDNLIKQFNSELDIAETKAEIEKAKMLVHEEVLAQEEKERKEKLEEAKRLREEREAKEAKQMAEANAKLAMENYSDNSMPTEPTMAGSC